MDISLAAPVRARRLADEEGRGGDVGCEVLVWADPAHPLNAVLPWIVEFGQIAYGCQ
jgi:hypothetical protein